MLTSRKGLTAVTEAFSLMPYFNMLLGKIRNIPALSPPLHKFSFGPTQVCSHGATKSSSWLMCPRWLTRKQIKEQLVELRLPTRKQSVAHVTFGPLDPALQNIIFINVSRNGFLLQDSRGLKQIRPWKCQAGEEINK